jgi:hypothetical protein
LEFKKNIPINKLCKKKQKFALGAVHKGRHATIVRGV